MKKSTLALSVAAVLGVAVVGGSWFTGSQAESRFREMIPMANQQLKALNAYGIEAEIQNPQFNRGFFSSDLSYDLKLKLNWLENPQQMMLNGAEKIYHGPLPLNRLQKLNLAPALLSSEGTLTSKDPELTKLFDNKPISTSQIDMAYSGNVDAEAKIAPFKSADNQLESGVITLNKKQDDVWLKADSVKFDSVQVEQLDYQLPMGKDEKYPAIKGLGKFTSSAKAVKVGNFNLENIQFNGDGQIKQDRLLADGKITFKSSVTEQGKTEQFADVSLKAEVDLDAEKFNQFSEKVSQNQQNDPETVKLLEELGANAPKFKVDLELENTLGKNQLLIDVQSGKLDSNNTRYDLNEALKLLNNSKIDLAINQTSMIELLKRLAGMTDNNSELATKTVTDLVQAGQQFGMVQVKGDEAKFNLSIENNQVKLNDKVLSEQELQGLLLMLALFGSGMGQ